MADEEKIRTMRNAVLSGADNLSERAKILSDKMTARKNGMYDAAFEDVITIPELKRAKEAYRRFMDKNGETILPQNAVANYVANQFKKTVQNLSLNGKISGNRQGISPLPEYVNSVAHKESVVNTASSSIDDAGYFHEYSYSTYDNPSHNSKVYDLISRSEKGSMVSTRNLVSTSVQKPKKLCSKKRKNAELRLEEQRNILLKK